MERHRISVIMSTYNEREDWLRAAVESILNQTHRDIEFIIVLDNPDNAALEALILEYAAADERIIFVKNEKNLGLVGALNHALGFATGEYIARMDADDISEPERLETELRVLTEEGVDLVSCRVVYIDEDGNRTGLSPCYGQTPEKCRKSLRYKNVLPHPGWLTKASVFAAVGGYHEIPMAEDYEWLCRAACMGFRARNIDAELLSYRLRGGSISGKNAYQQYRTATAIRAEYGKALRGRRAFDCEALRRRIDRIDFTRPNARYDRSLDIYRDGWQRLRHKRVTGLFRIAGAYIMYPGHLVPAFKTLLLRQLNR